MKKIGIIGGGFSGTMTAVQLIIQSTEELELIVIDREENMNKGNAYRPYSEKQLLNVPTGRMSAFPDLPDHFLNWVMTRPEFEDKDLALIAQSLPRSLYRDYLFSVWKEALLLAEKKGIQVTVIDGVVDDLEMAKDKVVLFIENEQKLQLTHCVIATGNHLPADPEIKNRAFYLSKNYFRNPWLEEAVNVTKADFPVLIIGNGLTMIDTVFGLQEHGFEGQIYAVSPNGFNVLPHRHNGLVYEKLVEELSDEITLFELLKLVRKHVRLVRNFGVSAVPVIDSLRPHTQKIWRSFTDDEKRLFLSRLRHLWGVARHRIPVHIHDKLQQLRIDAVLHVVAGKLTAINETSSGIIEVDYLEKKTNREMRLLVSRVINCTGPCGDIAKQENSLLNKCYRKGLLMQDKFRLGVVAETASFRVMNTQGKPYENLYTIGCTLTGELWESTAVNELRTQAMNLAKSLLLNYNNAIY